MKKNPELVKMVETKMVN